MQVGIHTKLQNWQLLKWAFLAITVKWNHICRLSIHDWYIQPDTCTGSYLTQSRTLETLSPRLCPGRKWEGSLHWSQAGLSLPGHTSTPAPHQGWRPVWELLIAGWAGGLPNVITVVRTFSSYLTALLFLTVSLIIEGPWHKLMHAFFYFNFQISILLFLTFH